HDELSDIVHKSRSQITNTMRLLTLSSYAQKELSSGKISQGHAKVLIGLDEEKQKILIQSILGQKLSVRDTEKLIKNYREKRNISQLDKQQNFTLESYEDRLRKALPFTHKIKANSIEIKFKNEDEINAFLSLLC
ncbi:MAG: chromosome partitioning protein ParB, partial [Sulfurovum sp.]|nr:chromosome partitioning protein ParB [Sulfurovum sp.]